MNLNRARQLARALDARELRWMHDCLTIYNGMVVTLAAAFMSITQLKVIQTYNARAFLEQLAAIPLPPLTGFLLTVTSFLILAGLGWLYREGNVPPTMRYICLSLEIVACVVIMRSLNLAYDGVVLLVVADLLHRYSGRHQLILLTVAMLGLYAIVDYNIVSLEYHIAPFNAYAAYYAAGPRAWILTLHNAFVSLNLILFVFYLTLLIRQNHQEKQRIASLNAQLEEANTRLRAYAIEAEAMAETRERNRLAREIHDTLGHALTGIAAGLDATSFLVDIAPDKAKEQLSKIKETALRGLKDVRRSVRKLRPDDLEQLPLHQAIEHMIDDFSASTGMKIDFEILQWPERLRPDQEEVLYRIVQEGMTNARRHGHAHHLTITIGTRRGIIYLLLADDGQGADIRRLQKGFGLRHMQERLALLHGKLRYWSDRGFTLEAIMPENEEASKFL
ncbi:sensor histidine kinase [Mitsuokella jalaludinii]|uniref:sensor histidine kinase n=1 Tax=Mitsuokella jalaludinii TaxID=187979 RepID=UPI003F97DB84